MKKIGLLALFLLISLAFLSASDITFGAGSRAYDDNCYQSLLFLKLEDGNAEASVTLRSLSHLMGECSFRKPLNQHVFVSYGGGFENYAFSSFSLFGDAELGLRGEGSHGFFSELSLGGQLGVASISQLQGLYVSASPVFTVLSGRKIRSASGSLFLSMVHASERGWKALPTAGVHVSYDFSSSFSVSFEAWCKFSEFMMDPWWMVTGAGSYLCARVTK